MALAVAHRIQANLLPIPDKFTWQQGALQRNFSLMDKVKHVVGSILQLLANLVFLPLALAYSTTSALVSRVISVFKEKPAIPDIPLGPLDPAALPEHFGFADSLFQTSGLGTSAAATPFAGVCNFDKWLNPRRIEGTTEGDYRRFFIDILRNPQPFINILRQMNTTAHRFSLEWAVIEPQKGQIDQEAVRLYRNFIQQLKNNGIEPYVTIHHFVCPEWFEQEGGFDTIDNIPVFRDHALRMMELFPEVKNWMPFNEINVDGFQKSVRGVYPPGRTGDIAGAGRMMRNMLLAHCQIYKAAKERQLDVQIGSTHQWLNFEPLEGNPLERLICYYLSKITHYAVYDFFRTGQFSLEIPTKANIQLSIPEAEFRQYNGFSDFIGVQFYGYPRLKAGFNGGEEYPGYGIINWTLGKLGLTFGSTVPKGGTAMSFGPGVYPESMRKCFTEAVALGKKIVVSETGGDAKVQKWGEKGFTICNETQKRNMEAIFRVIGEFRQHIKAFFIWTLVRGHLEWDRGDFPSLGVVDILKDQDRNIVGHHMTPTADLIQGIYGARRNQLQQAIAAA